MIHIIFLVILAYYGTRLSIIHNNLSGVMSMPQYHRSMQVFLILFLVYYWYKLYHLTKRTYLVHMSGICLLSSLLIPFKRSSHDFFSECHTYLGFIGILFVAITLIMMLIDFNSINTYKTYKLVQLLLACFALLATVLCFLADITSLFEWLCCLCFILFIESYQRYNQ